MKEGNILSQCPHCGCKKLLDFEENLFCLDCSWDSLKMSVERGDLDNIYDAFDDQQVDTMLGNEDLLVITDEEALCEANEMGGSAA